jgi:hypothetical protein
MTKGMNQGMGNPFFSMRNRRMNTYQRQIDFAAQVQASRINAELREQGAANDFARSQKAADAAHGRSEQAAEAAHLRSQQAAEGDHGRAVNLLNVMNEHERIMGHANRTQELKLGAQAIKADASRIKAQGVADANVEAAKNAHLPMVEQVRAQGVVDLAHAQGIHANNLAATQGEAAVNLSRANWEGANQLANTVGSFAPARVQEFNPMSPPSQPSAPTISSPTVESPATPAEKPKRTRTTKPKPPVDVSGV